MSILTEKETYKLLYNKLKTNLEDINVSFAIPDITDINAEYVWLSHVMSSGYYFVDAFALVNVDVHILAPSFNKATQIATTIESLLHKQSLGTPNIFVTKVNSLWYVEEVENSSLYHYVITFVCRSKE